MHQTISIGIIGLPIKKDKDELRFLLSKRHQPDRPLWHNKWQLIGGGLEWGETPEQTLSREFEEEIQVSVKIIFPNPMVKTSTWYGKDNNSDHDSHILLLCYLVDIGDQAPDHSEDEETAEAKWFTIDEVAKLDTLPNTRQFVLEYQEMLTK